MFANVIKLKVPTVTAIETAVVDGPSNRKTIRSNAGGDLGLTIAHQESNENPGFSNQRSNVRLYWRSNVPESDKTVQSYVQLTISVPKDIVSASEVTTKVGQLFNFLLFAENEEGAELTGSGALLAVPRLYAGEP